MNKKQEDFEKAVKALQASADELKEGEALRGFENVLNGMVKKGVASLIEDYLWGE